MFVIKTFGITFEQLKNTFFMFSYNLQERFAVRMKEINTKLTQVKGGNTRLPWFSIDSFCINNMSMKYY